MIFFWACSEMPMIFALLSRFYIYIYLYSKIFLAATSYYLAQNEKLLHKKLTMRAAKSKNTLCCQNGRDKTGRKNTKSLEVPKP